ncbi:MAG: ROK family protein [Tannerella sp.]|jgi:glucokinase|nr:ROK family protein [Tannerella sp.]
MRAFIGVDLGGTNIRAGRIMDDVIEVQNQVRTPKDAKDEWVTVEAIKEVIHTVMNEHVVAIGIGVPSVVDRAMGIVYDVANIPHWKEVHLKKVLEKEFEIPVYLDNDANCFALAERTFGVGRDFENFVGLTIGTGLGGGIIQQGKLLQDANCGSGEFGTLPYKDNIVEYYASGSFFSNVYGVDGNVMYHLALNQDPEALDAYRQLGKHIGEAVKMVILTVDPQMIVFGGTVAGAHALYEEALYASLQDFAFPSSIKKLKLFFSEMEHPGILGAASLCY